MKLVEYIDRKYDCKTRAITAKEAMILRIPWPLPKDWVKSYGDMEITQGLAGRLYGIQNGKQQTQAKSILIQELGVTPMRGRPPTIQNKNTKFPARRWLHVPYAERDLAKTCGAKWDSLTKMWWVPMSVPLESVKRWVRT